MNAHPRYTDIIAFGDSLFDLNNSFSLTLGFIPPLELYFEGRFSNGFLSIETLSKTLGLSLDPYYDNLNGNNFAVGGARTGRDNSNNDNVSAFGLVLPGLADQIDAYLTELNGNEVDSQTLYSLWAGPNDYLDYLGARSAADPAVLLEQSIQNIEDAITRLNRAGATQFLIPNISLARLPATALSRIEADNISRAFNASLAIALNQFERDHDNVDVFEVDIYGITEQVANAPSSFGFNNVVDPFLIPGVTPPDPSQTTGHFFWDLFHPTGEGHALFAETFNQTLTGQISQPSLNSIQGTTGPDLLRGTRNADNIEGLSSSDVVFGRAGNDRIRGDEGSDRIFGNHGKDILQGGNGQDMIWGGPGKDIIWGGDHHDQLWGQAQDDIVIGDDGDDIIRGGAGKDYLLGGRGHDLIWGQSHNDSLNGGENNDSLWGGGGNDILEGGAGDDTLIGGRGLDTAKYRHSFDDFIFKGTANNIRVIGPEGKDTLKNIEILQFSDRSLNASDLNFLPAPLYQTVLTQSTVIPTSGDPVDIYYPAATRSADAPSLPIALFVQGANVDKSLYSEFANVFASYGFAVLIPNNLRTLSPPPPAPSVTGLFPELSQVTEILDYVQNSQAFPLSRIIDSEKLILLGHSFGGAVGLSAVNGECPLDNCPFGTFDQPDELVGAAFFGTNLKPPPIPGQSNTVPPIDNEDIPTALVLGENDGRTSPEATEETFFAIQNPPKALISLTGTNHFGITDRNAPVNPMDTPEDVPPIVLDDNPQDLPQQVAINEIATWSAQFLRATVFEDQSAFDFVLGGVGDQLDSNVTVMTNPIIDPVSSGPDLRPSLF